MNLKGIRDDIIIKEAIERLLDRVKAKTGIRLKFGNFTLNMHEGKCVNIEFNLKDRCFALKTANLHGGNNG